MVRDNSDHIFNELEKIYHSQMIRIAEKLNLDKETLNERRFNEYMDRMDTKPTREYSHLRKVQAA